MLKLKKVESVWHVHGTIAGKRIRKSTGTDNRQSAQKELRRLEREAWEESHAPQVKQVAFEDAALAYIEQGGEMRFLAPVLTHFKGVDIVTIKSGHIHDAARTLYPSHKPATLNRQVITPVQAVLNFAAERGWRDPIRVTRFKAATPARRAADKAWLRAFMNACEDEELATLALFMFTTGARIGDALRIMSINGREVTMMTKAGKHTATMSRELMLRMTGPFRWKWRSAIYKPWKATCEAADIEYLSPHEAGRHAFATEMIVRNGIDPMTTRDLGGWKSTRMLERYAHPEGVDAVVDSVFGKSVASPKKATENKG